MKIHSLHQPVAFVQREKTVIRKGVIVRYPIWVDQNGNEYDKRINQYVLTKPVARTSVPLVGQPPPPVDLTDVWLLLFCLMATSCMVGFTLALFLTQKKSAKEKEKICHKSYPVCS
jgi:hypothetical protein